MTAGSSTAAAGRRLDVAGLGLGLSILAAVAGVALMSTSLVDHLAWWWARPEGSHGWLIPLVSAFILWQRRHRIAAAPRRPSWIGAVVFAGGLVLFAFDDIAQLQRFALPALVVMAFGGSLAVLGWPATRYVAPPLAFLLFAMAPPGGLYVWLSLQLQFISSELGATILQTLGISVFLDGNVIDLGTYKMQVAEACSGLRYLFPFTSLAFLCAWMYRAPLWAKFLVLVSVLPITIVTNAARIALTGVFIEHGSVARAEGVMHLLDGWVVFLIAMLMLFVLMWVLAQLRRERRGIAELLDVDRLAGEHIRPAERRTGATDGGRGWRLARPWTACLVLMLVIVPLHTAIANRGQVVPERPGLVTFPLQLGDWRGQTSSIDAQTQAALGATDFFLADYAAAEAAAPVNLWVTYFDDQVRKAAMHTPQQCLPGAGWEFVTLETIDAPMANHAGEPFRLNRALVTNNDQRLLIYYWVEARGGQYLDPRGLKYGNLWASVVDGRSDGGLVRLTTPIRPGVAVAEAEARLVDFMRAAYPRLEPHLGS
jgi:exosortase D (VPLPA-CTERM-specific)